MSDEEFPLLELETFIGFNGSIPQSLLVHPDEKHLIYSIGCNLIIENISSGKQCILTEHTNTITAIAVSKTGKYIASGQDTFMGYKADVIIWDYPNRQVFARLEPLHKVKVQSLSFSPTEIYLATLGGTDDGSVVVWDIENSNAICGSQAQASSAGDAKVVCFSNTSDQDFVTAGDKTLRCWKLDINNRKIKPEEVDCRLIKRIVNCVEYDENDGYVYCGTTTGDILVINLSARLIKDTTKHKVSLGVTSLKKLVNNQFLTGSGDGTLALGNLTGKPIISKKLDGAITSIALRGNGHEFFVATNKSQIYRMNLEMKAELYKTCHYKCINDIVFPDKWNKVYCTASYQDIRVWQLDNDKELLRITVPNLTCNAVAYAKNGKSLVSAWNDGQIRAFLPESGKLMYQINNAHNSSVTAIAVFSDNKHVISGGKEGTVRVWNIEVKPTLEYSLKEHQNEVTCIKLAEETNQCVTSCMDGSCIIWDLTKRCRVQLIKQNNLFKGVCYHTDGHFIVTVGTDRKICYWEILDGTSVRELQGSKSPINTLDISPCGKYFISGGDDKLLKVWKYEEGVVEYVGKGHGAPIIQAKICPGSKNIVTVSDDGAIIRWKFPFTE